jgi:hypothetical protein
MPIAERNSVADRVSTQTSGVPILNRHNSAETLHVLDNRGVAFQAFGVDMIKISPSKGAKRGKKLTVGNGGVITWDQSLATILVNLIRKILPILWQLIGDPFLPHGHNQLLARLGSLESRQDNHSLPDACSCRDKLSNFSPNLRSSQAKEENKYKVRKESLSPVFLPVSLGYFLYYSSWSLSLSLLSRSFSLKFLLESSFSSLIPRYFTSGFLLLLSL